MDDPRKEFHVRPVGTRPLGRFLPIATFVVGLFLGAALFKPWDLLFPPVDRAVDPASGPVSVVDPTPLPSATPAPTPGVPVECAFAGGWRVFALGQRDPLGGDGTSGSATPADGSSGSGMSRTRSVAGWRSSPRRSPTGRKMPGSHS